jgi:GT2 family glycosyltransferase/glycosyltransferase involved in cell wall biosynthesis
MMLDTGVGFLQNIKHVLPLEGGSDAIEPVKPGSRLGDCLSIEFGAPNGSGLYSAVRSLESQAIVSKISFTNVPRYGRLTITLPGTISEARSTIIFQALVRSNDEPLEATIGLVGAVRDKGWVWCRGTRKKHVVATEWNELTLVWDGHTDKDPEAIIFEVTQEAEIEFARLVVARLPNVTPNQKSEVVVNQSGFVEAQLNNAIVVRTSAAPASRRFRAFLEKPFSEFGLQEASVIQKSASGNVRCKSQISFVSNNTIDLDVFLPMESGTIVLQLTKGRSIPLYENRGWNAQSNVKSCTYQKGRLRVEVEISSDYENLAGLSLELRSHGLTLQKCEVAALDGEAGLFIAKLEVACSKRTAEQTLGLVIPLLGLNFPCILQNTDSEFNDSTVMEIVDFADAFEGSFDGLRTAKNGTPLLCGWARNPNAPGAAVIVDAMLQGTVVASGLASGPRKDVAAKRGGSPICAFAIEVPSNTYNGETVKAGIRIRGEKGTLSSQERDIRFPPFGEKLDAEELPVVVRLASPSEEPAPKTVSGVVLTQNGAQVLDDLLKSILSFESETFSKIVIIDHESTDNTHDVVRRYESLLPLTYVVRSNKNTFSSSNNYGVSLCDEDVIVFLNNDIVFQEPVVATLLSHLSKSVGAVGLKLLDPPSYDGEQALQHVAIHFDTDRGASIRPFESRFLTDASIANVNAVHVPAVTAAFLVVDRKKFLSVGGYDESYFYGWEDIDLCLRLLSRGLSNISVNSAKATHVRGYSRRQMSRGVVEKRQRNSVYFLKRWGWGLRSAIRRAAMEGTPYWTGRKIHVGFIVTEAGPEATAGDYMTALDFGRGLAGQIPVRSFFFAKDQPVDATGIDIMITMIDDFDVREVKNLSLTCTMVAWTRNWFHRWVARPWRERFNIWLASSELAAKYITAELGRAVGVVKIGTDLERFGSGSKKDKLAADISFTGHFWGSAREVVSLIGEGSDLNLKIFGKGWGDHPVASKFWGGALPYHEMTDVYASCRIVIDDSNFATATWGSLNSRVFDAMAAGALVITNNEAGSIETFNGLLPTYSDRETLLNQINYFLDEEKRLVAISELRSQVELSHTYDVRASQFLSFIRHRSKSGLRLAIKICSPNIERAEGWGDWYFACSLRRELENLGHSVRIDFLDEWHGPHASADDVVLAIRGLNRYEPRKDQINILWVISHPDMVSVDEISDYDICYSASRMLPKLFQKLTSTKIEFLPQCTDENIFFWPKNDHERNGVVFVGNSRGVHRPVVMAAVDSGIDLDIYGSGWDELDGIAVKAPLISNNKLGDLYRGASVVLNDHWDDMRRWGIISNRIFDAIACGTPVISDDVVGLGELFGSVISTVDPEGDFRVTVAGSMSKLEQREERKNLADKILAKHTFRARAVKFDRVIKSLVKARENLEIY